MKESFVTPLLLALLFVGVTLGISFKATPQRTQLAQVSGVESSANLAGSFSVSVSSDFVCTSGRASRMVGFFATPPTGGYFTVYGTGAIDLGDRESGLYEFSPGTYTWEGKVRTGFMRTGAYTGSFTVSGACEGGSTTASTSAMVPSTSPLRPVSVMVSVGAQCALEKNMTQVAVSLEPRDGASVVFQKENGNVITSTTQGIVYLPNGTYTWKAQPKEGSSISGNGTGTFTLGLCPSVVTPSVLVGSTCDLIEEGVPVTFGLGGEGKAYYTLTNTITKETMPLESGVEFVPNGSYTWAVVTASGASVIIDGPSSGNFQVSACKSASSAPYVPPKSGTVLFFREGKLIDPIVRQGEKIALRVDLAGVTGIELELVGKDSREILGAMTKDGASSRWLFAWNVGAPLPGDYDVVARAKGSKGQSVSGSRIVTIISGSDSVTSMVPSSHIAPPVELPDEVPSLGVIEVPEEPVFDRLIKEGSEESLLTLAVRGVADLISTGDILLAKNTLPDVIRTPQDLRVFCSSETNDDVCFEFLPEALREEAKNAIDDARAEIARAFRERPTTWLDGDKDGISDFDETHFYGTDSQKADTDGDGKKDHDELLLDTNPLEGTAKSVQVLFENPIFGGEERPELFVIEDVRVATGTPLAKGILPIVLSGKALPRAVVTLYIYSDPMIVRVTADELGYWSHTLTKELPDGSHKAFVALTDSAGRILAKSAPIPFVKNMETVTVADGTLPGASVTALHFFTETPRHIIIILVGGFIGCAVLVVSFIVRSRKKDIVVP